MKADRECFGHSQACCLDRDLLKISVEVEPDGFRGTETLEQICVQMDPAAPPDRGMHP